MDWCVIQREHYAVLGPLISGFSHRLNNILGGVYGMAGFLSEKADDARQLRRLKIVEDGVKQAADVIDSLYYLSPDRDVQAEQISLTGFIEAYIARQEILQTVGFESGTDIDLKMSAELLTLMLDEALKNTVEHAGGEGAVVISVGNHAAGLPAGPFVMVSDDGCGCDTPMDELFLPFVTGKGRCDHAGLGLCRMAGIIWSFSQGWIAAKSTPGKGFQVCFGVPEVA